MQNLVREIKAKMVSANQISGFLNQPFLQSKWMKQRNSFHIDINSQTLKVDQTLFGLA